MLWYPSNKLDLLITLQNVATLSYNHENPKIHAYTYMQFLAARSLWTSFLLAKYSIPLATCRHMSISFDVTST